MKTDARVRYTRKVIQDAFLDALKEKPIARITVKEVCDKAEINRGTFYKHYQDCYDLLDKIEEEGLREFEKMLASIEAAGAQAALATILNILRDNSALIQALNTLASEQRFIQRLSEHCFLYMEQWLGPVQKDDRSVVRRDAGFAFLAGGSSGVIQRWLRDGMQESPEEIAALIIDFCEGAAGKFAGHAY